jgi:GNAT superfamily N-acetyltransferase
VLTVRVKTSGDAAACVALALAVHHSDGYPRYLPEDLDAFMRPPSETAAWVADFEGEVVGHLALRRGDGDPALPAAQRTTGLSAEDIAVVARLMVSRHVRRRGVADRLLAAAQAFAREAGQRLVLDVVRDAESVSFYERLGWQLVEPLRLDVGEGRTLDLLVYISPADDT